ncbi:MAG: AAA family ATPase [Desulfococcaceae bacterium]|jgi:predicted ATP-dependent endonuclease of OLD family|nr:AAA family ATPase [Desulfococcaceae bacterium]
MNLQLKNTGMIKEAIVKIEGLSVIAGENDTGKSTVGKVLFKKVREYLLSNKKQENLTVNNDEILNSPLFIETPDLLAKFNYIKNTYILLQQNQLNFPLPIEVTDLILRISQPQTKNKNIKLFQYIKNIIAGEVYYDKSRDDIFYKKGNLRLEMYKTSNGIKMFGFFQMLILNESIKEGSVLILDEPEVHLHPKWQLLLAEFIVNLVDEMNVKVLVTSHSPYIIDALKYYADKIKINNNFYLAEKKDKYSVIKDVTVDVSPIFQKLTEPLAELRKMKLAL